ncbi:Alpha/Beta hydrolase protein [Kalaharituber pfeilii]|nr:Alpha/Beta hydrolase protein [Kalaharituber pfeilii]
MRLALSTSCVSSLALLLALPLCLAVAAPTPTVTAPSGKIVGQPGRLDPSVYEFLGIPYAQPPTGTLRFRPPVRLPNRSPESAPFVATKFGLSCPSLPVDFGPGNPYNFTGTAEGEDCLSLNVWTKPGRANAPVMVWIYGGGYILGGTDTLMYDGTQFAANHEVVLVSVNYRTNVFGFPNSPAVGVENLGILDQRLALEWIRDNIHAFGGSPDKITLFGQSAGGTSVDVHAYAWARDPIVKALIPQSGTVELLRTLSAGDGFYPWGNLTEKVGCSNAGSEKQKLQCMQKLPWEALIEGMNAMATCQSGLFLGFGPRVDGKVIFSSEEYQRRGKAGLFAKVPLLVGNTDREFLLGGLLMPPAGSCPVQELPGSFGPEVIANISTAVLFSCPVREAANRRLLHNVPVWRYRYYGSFNSGYAAGHGAEVPALFGAAQHVRDLSERDDAFIKYLQSVWVAFATAPSTGLSAPPFNLAQYNPNKPTLIRLDYEQELEASATHPYNYDYLCDVLSPPSILCASMPCGLSGSLE